MKKNKIEILSDVVRELKNMGKGQFRIVDTNFDENYILVRFGCGISQKLNVAYDDNGKICLSGIIKEV